MDTSTILRLQSYQGRRRTPLNISRSREPDYKEVHRLQDATRYNSFYNRVFAFKSLPNRLDTPKKPPEKQITKNRSFYKLNVLALKDEDDNYIDKSMTLTSYITPQAKQQLIRTSSAAQLKKRHAGPRIIKHHPGLLSHVMNDYHMRASNPGFSRKDDGGGIFTR